jgi:hypothetical protein
MIVKYNNVNDNESKLLRVLQYIYPLKSMEENQK